MTARNEESSASSVSRRHDAVEHVDAHRHEIHDVLGLPEDPYRGEDILTHEFAHTMHTLGLRHADPEFERALRRAFENARSQGLWKGTYASTSPEEYWAEGVQSWFDRNRSADPPDGVHNAIATRERLRVYDPKLARLLERVFGGD